MLTGPQGMNTSDVQEEDFHFPAVLRLLPVRDEERMRKRDGMDGECCMQLQKQRKDYQSELSRFCKHSNNSRLSSFIQAAEFSSQQGSDGNSNVMH